MSDERQAGLFTRDVAPLYPRKKAKSSGPREHYVNWGGLFAHPTEDIDVFVRLPRWRQREILSTQAAFKKDPTLQAYELHDMRTGKVCPSQNVFAPPERLYQSIKGQPNSVKYNVPDGIPLSYVKKFGSTLIKEEIDRMDKMERQELGYLFGPRPR